MNNMNNMNNINNINNYIIDELISGGSFGRVYKCHKNNNVYALKEDNVNLLKYEANIYRIIRNIKNISKLIDFFSYNNKYYLVLDYFDYTLKYYKSLHYNSNNYNYNLKNIFDSLLYTLEDIHNMGILHRDLKPDNICFNKYNEPHIIDFGLAKKYSNKGKHNAEKNIKSIIGSNNFISLNVMNLIEPSRRDDIESLIYIYFYMLICNDTYIIYDNLDIILKKNIIYILSFLEKDNVDFDIINNIENSLVYIRRLRFSQTPNYNLLKNIMLNL
tara:strand:+ start:1 stop:819 length:819 start_codon:yes stop_codon:yes gene_type:complete